MEVGSATNGNDGVNSLILINDLITRGQTLLSELRTFRDRIRTLRHEGIVETATFRGTVESEVSSLQRLASKPEHESTLHVARSSNLPFLEQVWNLAKSSKHLLALQKRVYLDPNADWQFQALHMHQSKSGPARKSKKIDSKDHAVIVDAITDGGRIWSKVSLVTETRLLFDLAKQGWECSESEDENEGRGDALNLAGRGEDDFDIPLVKTTKQLLKVSRAYRVRTRHPTVRLILPRIKRGQSNEVERILQKCEANGALISCSDDIQALPLFEESLQAMARDPVLDFSDTLNIDCTILLALVSDLSHAAVSKESWFHKGLQRQVEVEGEEKLLPSLLYPVLSGHELYCTTEAAQRMQEIVDTIGTPTEKARTALLISGPSDKTDDEVLEEFAQLSAYAVPPDLRIPLKIVDQDFEDCQANLPDAAVKITYDMSPLNKAVFCFGWASGRTTITSNRNIVKLIENDMEKFEDLEDEAWPSIWLCPTARSLVGKERRGPPPEAKNHKSLKTHEPLHREHMRRHGLDVLSMREGQEVEDLRPGGYPRVDLVESDMASVSLKEL